uniref:Uncharacterized protein n=1 Tax=Methylophaga nitratireducenticrescens TaxID=754476 RepID=I1XI00_METNJ
MFEEKVSNRGGYETNPSMIIISALKKPNAGHNFSDFL